MQLPRLMRQFTGEDDSRAKKLVAKTPTTSSSSSSSFTAKSKLFYYAATLALIFLAAEMKSVAAMPRCAPCPGGECPDPPEGSCPYGIVTNFCGRRVCAKGPGEVCGTGMFKMLGTCGDGMYCNCGRCIGCSILTMECFDKTCTK